ncbi:hypothetical protein CDAR_13831 [Caerostris darwini]|uniref:Uncharacterized protein n=1 Tax=Caerostris darwini TaxID=1538125 RepID=A0AAV4U7V5_9ARAC|nr:hypothetical protein CDAR_13831 [Caerostris darwini]
MNIDHDHSFYCRTMNQMDTNTEGNGPSQDPPQVLSPQDMDATTTNSKESEKVSPEGMCRQISTAFKEMDVIDTIVAHAQRSDLPQDYIQMNENLLKKRQYLVEWDEDNKDNISDEIAKTMLYYSRISEAYKSSSRESVIDSKPMCKIQPLQKVPINTKHSEPAIIYIKSEGSDEEIEPPHQKETTIELSNTAKPQHLQANSSFVKKYISNKRSRPTSFLRNKSRAPTTVRPGSSVSRTSINSVSRDESCDDLGTYIASRLKRRKAGQLQLEIVSMILKEII